MRVVNIEKLDGHKTIVLTGRDENIRKIVDHLNAKLHYAPQMTDNYQDYPMIASGLKEIVDRESRDSITIIATQSEEFLDCLLQSDIDFVVATVRKYDTDDDDMYRLRVMPKQEALDCRNAFNMEFRI